MSERNDLTPEKLDELERLHARQSRTLANPNGSCLTCWPNAGPEDTFGPDEDCPVVALLAAARERDTLNETIGALDRTAQEWCRRNSALAARVSALEEALRPFATFAKQWERKPIKTIDDEVYAIHVGTEYEASLRRSDCAKARAVLGEGHG